MEIPTVTEIREIMVILKIEPSDIGKSLGISDRSAYRMISSVNEPSIKDRAAVCWILFEYSKGMDIETNLYLKEEVFCSCEEPEAYESEQMGYTICLNCKKRIKKDGSNENQN